jgi:hypothetical protein
MLAQGGNDWGWVVPAIFVLIWVLSFLWNNITGAAKKQNRQQPRGERPLPRPGQGQQPAPQVEDSMQARLNNEIEEFLRRANERRAAKNRSDSQPPQQQPAQQSRSAKSQRSNTEKKNRTKRESIAQSVEEHLGSNKFQSREQHLTDDLTRSELEMSQHVQQVFEHRLGSLGESTAEGQPTTGETRVTQSAEQKAEALAVAGLLINQENLRRAVILREILERPTDRW